MSSNLQSGFGVDPSTDLLVKIGVCFRLGTMHQIGNAALRKPMMELVKAVNAVFDKNAQEVRVQCVKDCFFVNRQIVTTDNEQAESIQMMRRVLRRLAVHEIAFRDRLSYEEMSDIIAAFQKRIWGMKDSQERIELHSKVELCVLSRSQREKLLRRGDRRAEVIQNYAMLALSLKKISLNFHDLKPISVTKLRKAIQLTYESFDGYEGLLVGLTRFTNPDGRSYFHAASVGTLIMLMCRKLGLPRQRTSELTLSGMLYDIARDSLTDPFQGGKINQQTIHQSLRRVERVPLRSLIRLSMGSPHKDDLIRATMAFNASQSRDMLDESANQLATNLISVASAYQLISAPIPPRRGLKPDQALALIRNSPERYSQEISDLLMLTLGPIPIGSVVRLSTGEIGVVSRVTDQTLFRPRIRILDDKGITTDKLIELSEHPDIQILETLDPVAQNINVARALIGDLSKEELRDVSDESVTSIALDEIELEEKEFSMGGAPVLEAEPEQAVETLSIEPVVSDENATNESMDSVNQTVEDEIEFEEPEPLRQVTKLEPLITDEIEFNAPVDVAISVEPPAESMSEDGMLDVDLFSNTDVPLSGQTTSVHPLNEADNDLEGQRVAPIRLSTANIQQVAEPVEPAIQIEEIPEQIAPIRLNTENLVPIDAVDHEPMPEVLSPDALGELASDLFDDDLEISDITEGSQNDDDEDDETVVEKSSPPLPPQQLMSLPSDEWQALPPLQVPAAAELELEIVPIEEKSQSDDIIIENIELEAEDSTQNTSDTELIIDDIEIDMT
ncbi:MAG: hypothetical protein VYC39_19195 [Myxococcota bacterium]|nr:hypothetical protein [Myxococcota bacterium]